MGAGAQPGCRHVPVRHDPGGAVWACVAAARPRGAPTLGDDLHQHVPAWRMAASRRQYAVPVDFREQCRGSAGPLPVSADLPLLRRRRSADPGRRRPDLPGADGWRERRHRRRARRVSDRVSPRQCALLRLDHHFLLDRHRAGLGPARCVVRDAATQWAVERGARSRRRVLGPCRGVCERRCVDAAVAAAQRPSAARAEDAGLRQRAAERSKRSTHLSPGQRAQRGAALSRPAEPLELSFGLADRRRVDPARQGLAAGRFRRGRVSAGRDLRSGGRRRQGRRGLLGRRRRRRGRGRRGIRICRGSLLSQCLEQAVTHARIDRQLAAHLQADERVAGPRTKLPVRAPGVEAEAFQFLLRPHDRIGGIDADRGDRLRHAAHAAFIGDQGPGGLLGHDPVSRAWIETGLTQFLLERGDRGRRAARGLWIALRVSRHRAGRNQPQSDQNPRIHSISSRDHSPRSLFIWCPRGRASAGGERDGPADAQSYSGDAAGTRHPRPPSVATAMNGVLRGIARTLFILIVVAAVGIGSFIGISLVYFSRELPNHKQLAEYVPAIGTKVYAGEGAFMTEFASEHRMVVPISQVPKAMIQAVLAAEDRDFYTHNGVNPTAIFRAAVADLTRFQRGQRPIGASTITQQIVRHFLLSNEVSVSRKVKEALLAYRIEHELSKNRILEIYLNEIYLGAGAYGVATAADTYFQKPLDKLTLAETAFIAALPKAPNNYNPARHPQAAKARRDWVLAGIADPPGTAGWQLAAVTAVEPGAAHIVLKKGGQGRISVNELRWARKTLDDQRLGAGIGRVSEVLQPGDIVLVEPVAAAAPAGRRGAPQPSAQYALRQIPDISGGLVVLDPKTGRVFAMVGGWSFQQSQFNRATQAKRQPGSAFKPFVFATALENGFSPYSVVEDAPISIPQGPGQTPWEPVNYEGSYVGETTLSDALIHSRNLVTARLAVAVGLPTLAKTVQNFDVMDRMPLYYSMSLGAGETTLLRLTSAYAMIDNGGHWLLPSVVDSVQDRQNRVIYQKGVKDCAACFVAAAPAAGAAADPAYKVTGAPPPGSLAVQNARFIENAVLYKPTKPDPLISDTADRELIAMMQGGVERGTGTAVAAVGKPLAGQTGTASDWFDAWFVGFSPDLAAGF